MPRGRAAPRRRVEDHSPDTWWVVDLDRDPVTPPEFVRRIGRELKIRFYARRTMHAYGRIIVSFLRWLNDGPAAATREHVRDYLELLVDGGASSAWVSVNLSALRTTFDKMSGRSITLGLETPRRPNKLPTVLSPGEIVRLLKAAPTLRDKLLLGLMYATGARVSEVTSLRWGDVDFDRSQIWIRGGKGRKDRVVALPESYRPLLGTLAEDEVPEHYLFPTATDACRHVSPRTAHRVMERAVKLAQIEKNATCHSLRHAYATHLLENGTDIRFIQKMLGHQKLETTTLYTRVATLPKKTVASPLDLLTRSDPTVAPATEAPREPKRPVDEAPKPVGRMRVELTPHHDPEHPHENRATATLHLRVEGRAIALDGLELREPHPGWVLLDLPPMETWKSTLATLTDAQRTRITDPTFFQFLQQHLTRRFLEAHPRPAATDPPPPDPEASAPQPSSAPGPPVALPPTKRHRDAPPPQTESPPPANRPHSKPASPEAPTARPHRNRDP
ncbi:tyrosine-type recombinase/integrase [Myxococcota bacterium]|nr:tyrosine-type recombinase/integrase [Myxococcota bacterium]